MDKYGQAAVNAVKLYTDKRALSVPEAWEKATIEIFGEGTDGQKKGCPRGAFLGLCEKGWVKDIPEGCYTKSIKNKQYALDAAAILRNSPEFAGNPKRLWEKVLRGEKKAHNHQMDVVVSLWNEELVSRKEKLVL